MSVDVKGDQSRGTEAITRPIGTRNPDPVVAQLEEELFGLLNETGIGPMGLGGDVRGRLRPGGVTVAATLWTNRHRIVSTPVSETGLQAPRGKARR